MPHADGRERAGFCRGSPRLAEDGAGVVWGWSGGGLMLITEGTDIEQLTRLTVWLWVRLCARCIEGAAPANPRRVPDVVCVSDWNRLIYVIDSRGR